MLRSTLTVGSMTFLSRITGFVRDMVIARLFGAGPATDAFFVAFRIPNLLRRLFAEGSFSLAFVPVFSEYREQRRREELRQLVDTTAGVLLAVVTGTVAIGVLAAPVVVGIFAPGFLDDPVRQQLATDLLRLTFPYAIGISFVALSAGVLNSFERFAIPAVTPVLLNLSLIGMAFVGARYFEEPIMALGWGVLAAAILQALLQIPALRKLGLLPRPRPALSPPVRKIMRLMLPTLFGSSVAQLNVMVDTLIASFLAAGAVSWLYFADRIVEFPMGVFGIALATVILPGLSRLQAAEETQGFRDTVAWAQRLALCISIPAAVGLLVLAKPIVVSLFEYDRFSSVDSDMAAWALRAYALGLPGFVFIKILAPQFFACQDTVTPVRAAVIALLSNVVLNAVFVAALVAIEASAPHVGLALASAGSAYINSALLARWARERGTWPDQLFVWRVIGASLLMGSALYIATSSIGEFALLDAPFRVAWLGTCVFGGVSLYTAAYFLFGGERSVLERPGNLR